MEIDHNLMAAKDPVRGTHPAAEIFPLLKGDEFTHWSSTSKPMAFAKPSHLSLTAACLIGGTACRRAARPVTPRFKRWEGEGSPVDYVVSMNLHRRHLDTSQRAMIAGRIATMRQGERRDLSEISGRLSQPEAAKLVKVSPDSVGFARKVLNEGDPALVKAVDRGDISVSAAARDASLPPEEHVPAHDNWTAR